MANLEYYARYPFLKESSQYIKEKGPTIEKLLDGPEYKRIRDHGFERVVDALEKEKIKVSPTANRADCLIEILSYPIARIIVSAVNDSFLIKRYALAEAERASDLMAKNERFETIIDIATELGLETRVLEDQLSDEKGANTNVCLNFADYLHFTSALRGGMKGEWKLVNQELKKGYVNLTVPKFLRVIQQVITMKLEHELPFELDKVIKDKFKNEVKDLKTKIESHKKTYKAENIGRLSVINLPPCMRKLLAMAQKGENIPHHGRFALTAFMHTLGMSSDEIIRLFSLSPDFDSKKSRYQVEHITGVISSTEYTPPECSTMKTYGICFDPDDLCEKDWMTHPLKYYRTKMVKRSKKGEEKAKSTENAPDKGR